ncbi:ATP-binding protein [Candidatus Riflebacteria bacterium]
MGLRYMLSSEQRNLNMTKTLECNCVQSLLGDEEETFTLFINSAPKILCVVRNFVDNICGLAGFDLQARNQIVLAVDEISTNIIRHGYSGAYDKKIKYEIQVKKDSVQIKIRDFGKKFNRPKIKKYKKAKTTPHGLGLFLVYSIMDEICFNTRIQSGTEIILTKYKRDSSVHHGN